MRQRSFAVPALRFRPRVVRNAPLGYRRPVCVSTPYGIRLQRLPSLLKNVAPLRGKQRNDPE